MIVASFSPSFTQSRTAIATTNVLRSAPTLRRRTQTARATPTASAQTPARSPTLQAFVVPPPSAPRSRAQLSATRRTRAAFCTIITRIAAATPTAHAQPSALVAPPRRLEARPALWTAISSLVAAPHRLRPSAFHLPRRLFHRLSRLCRARAGAMRTPVAITCAEAAPIVRLWRLALTAQAGATFTLARSLCARAALRARPRARRLAARGAPRTRAGGRASSAPSAPRWRTMLTARAGVTRTLAAGCSLGSAAAARSAQLWTVEPTALLGATLTRAVASSATCAVAARSAERKDGRALPELPKTWSKLIWHV
mmetsp:Transcript_4765/g.7297  ORF Transcript_4765/g.7297 Transcript_4765/m.7297 type:complete len:312 (+) Transcript_4765:1281-2216(+)